MPELRVWLTEEYGYREWLWTFPGTKEQLVQAWKEGRSPLSFWGPREEGTFDGKLEQIDFYPDDEIFESESEEGFAARAMVNLSLLKDHEEIAREVVKADATGHVHEEEDTWLLVDGTVYPAIPPPGTPPPGTLSIYPLEPTE